MPILPRLVRGAGPMLATTSIALGSLSAAWADDAARRPEGTTPAAAPSPEARPSPDPASASTRPGVEVTGLVDAYYGYNFNRPATDTPLRNFDTRHNSFSLSLIELAVEQKPSLQNRLGFRVDLQYGPTADLVHVAEPGGPEFFKNLEQAYASYLGGSKLQVDVGKFVTPAGAEVIEAKDNFNYSRSLLFALAIPYYHVGLRAAYPFSDKVSLTGYLINGWNDGVDNNAGKSWALSATVKPRPEWTVVANVIGGPEQKADSHDHRLLSDTVVIFSPTSRLSLIANYDYALDRVAGARVKWQGWAGYARFQVTPSWALAPRVEWLSDRDGFLSGTAQRLRELTLTSEHKLGAAILTRLEYRRDISDKPFFAHGDEPRKEQSTLTIGLIYLFGWKI